MAYVNQSNADLAWRRSLSGRPSDVSVPGPGSYDFESSFKKVGEKMRVGPSTPRSRPESPMCLGGSGKGPRYMSPLKREGRQLKRSNSTASKRETTPATPTSLPPPTPPVQTFTPAYAPATVSETIFSLQSYIKDLEAALAERDAQIALYPPITPEGVEHEFSLMTHESMVAHVRSLIR
eukprot:TRINITY_DN16657_c0_g1_i1.p1 TRINITY_DN16657_c0_g1~~TRINITY_DN16657_c0_g1_i1.p1  ORF type:complete len:179 (+),score=10.78 TRINITY_DN16657_c0_g1_i1:52-588(+)